jgi:hypothetical protein
MTTESKSEVLKAWDALSKVRRAAPGKRTSGFACDYCGGLEASSEPHKPACPIYDALFALLKLLPPFEDREKWMRDSSV